MLVSPKKIAVGIISGILPNLGNTLIIGIKAFDLFGFFVLYGIILIIMVLLLTSKEIHFFGYKVIATVMSYILSGMVGLVVGYKSFFVLMNPDYVREYGGFNAGAGFGILYVLLPMSFLTVTLSLLLAYLLTKLNSKKWDKYNINAYLI